MSVLTDAIVIGFLLSALYALVAVGFTMIFGVGGVLNVAHAAYVTIAPFLMFYATKQFGLPAWPAAILAVLFTAVFSVAVYVGPVRLVEGDPIVVVIVTLLLFLIVEEMFLALEGTAALSIPTLVSGRTKIADVTVLYNQILMFVLSWLSILGVLWYINRTRQGRAIRAVSMSKRGAALVGIKKFDISVYTWFIAGALAAIAGLFLGMFQTVVYNMGLNPLVLAFSIVILGGIGSIRGSIVGAHVIAFLETFTTSFVSPRLTGLAPLVLLVIVLVARPTGLFGREEASD
ncbi:branched-chain amino acid ABC transporter permease [Halorarius litoreus]|uniref:branched-chain amino acid ABC transporter permease n=1 Tax=Halorarius litoreus TaxID=2962676 RepID=UPI0020CDAC72|nr:branched-chain amino acid ABC transporter permease [Halorarius litoreus]